MSEPPPPPPMPQAPGQTQRNFANLANDLTNLSFGHYSFSSQGYRKLSEDLSAQILGPKTSLILPHLRESEKKFFELVASSNVDAVKAFLQETHGFNINCMNFQGVTALHIAVENYNEPMVEFLLTQENIDISDNVLHSIRNNNIRILKMLLEKMNEISPGLEFVGCTHSSEFPDHITPMILACQCGHYEIIELLIERGHRITKPHPPDCICSECKARLLDDDLLHAETHRLNVYRAICNPAYISHSTLDPILTAFRLSRELQNCSRFSPEFRVAYSELAQEISSFAVELIGCCRTTEEMGMVLRQSEGLTAASHFMYPRLVLALDYKQKEFVAHPNTQQLVETAWHGDWHEWRAKNSFIRFVYVATRILLLPIMALMCLVMPRHNLVKHWQIPLNKMISHNASYFVFLVLLFLQSNLDKTEQKREPPHSGLEPFIVTYVFGFIWSSLRLCAIQGPARYFRNMWNWFDLIMYVLFILTFVFWLASYYDVREHDQVDLERKYWHHLDPVLVSEGCFAIAVIMAFFRLLYLCRLNYYLGPLQISLGKMSADIAKYLTMFCIIIVAFSAGMCKFYQYYEGMVQEDTSSGIKTAQVSSFVSFSNSLKTFFWALLCMSDLASADVIIENLPGETEGTTTTNSHSFTEAVGYISFALFEVLTVIVILNMLIATMSSTFQRVTDNVDVEWTFGKTLFYLEYLNQTTLPPPFNLIPTGAGISSLIEWLQVFSKSPPGKTAHCSPFNCCYIDTEADETLAKQFPIIMAQLVQRYFREKDSNADTTESEIDQIKMEINDLKQMIKDLFPKE